MSDLPAPEPRTYKAISPRKPIRKLDSRGQKLCQLMTFGFDDEAEALKWGLPAFEPLSLDQAAKPAGLRRSNARFVFAQPIFLKSYSEALGAMRSAHKARAVMTMAQIMDDAGENTAADRAVRLKASQALMGDSEGRGGTTVNVALNQSSVTLQPGVVIRLPAGVAAPPLERMDGDGEIIDVTPQVEHDDKIKLDPETPRSMARNWPHVGGDE
jgi:hypothetical protein